MTAASPMTEKQWLECPDPRPMLEFLRKTGCGSERKFRLFSCSCVRRVWSLLKDQRSKRAVEAAENFVDDPVAQEDMELACKAAYEAGKEIALNRKSKSGGATPEYFDGWRDLRAANAATQTGQYEAFRAAQTASDQASRAACLAAFHGNLPEGEEFERLLQEHRQFQADILRDIFGPLPFRSMYLEPSLLVWMDGSIPSLAKVIYEDRAWEQMPRLTGALEDAGLDNQEILAHLRHEGQVHVRGCWCLDLILQRS